MTTRPVIAFFNNKGGVGKTSLVYHIAWMLADLGHRCLAVDLDPQSNLTAAMLDENSLERIWDDGDSQPKTIFSAVRPLMRATGDIAAIAPQELSEELALLPGDLRLSAFEDNLADAWSGTMDKKEAAFRTMTAFSRTILSAANNAQAHFILIDVGPNLGALNRAALIASDFVVVPMAPDLFSLQGLRNLGPTLKTWREGWEKRRNEQPEDLDFPLPLGKMTPIGYVVLQHRVRLDRPVQAYTKWTERIPAEYSRSILGQSDPGVAVEQDSNCIGMLKHYASLIPLAQEARKPVFHLRAADGALGSHAEAARRAGQDYRHIADQIIVRTQNSPSHQ